MTAAIAAASDGDVLDLGHSTLRVTSPVTVNKSIEIKNGSIAATNHRCLAVTAADVTLRNVSFTRTADGSTGIGRAIVSVAGEGFQSIDSNYEGVTTGALTLTVGACDGARITGGRFATTLRVQDASGIVATAGLAGHNDIVIDGVTVTEGVNGIALFDCSDSVITNCTVSNARALPQQVLTPWVNVGGDIWRAEDRPDGTSPDGTTRVLRRDGVRVVEDHLAGVSPGVNRWAYSGGFVYYNTASDPNGSTMHSDIVSGYGIMIYRGNKDVYRNLISYNDVSDCDGFGIYLQMATAASADNATLDNVVDLTCLVGDQYDALGWGGIGVVAGTGTTITDDTITNTGVSGEIVCGFRQIIGGASVSSDGAVDGVTVDTVFGNGFRFDTTAWTYTNCSVVDQTFTAFVGGTAV